MPTVDVLDMQGKKVSEINLNESVFGIEPNKKVLHEVVVNHLANKRQGTQSTLTRAEVSGGGKKPWSQKGTGRARQGSTRSPQWTHGGLAFAPKPRDYSYRVNKKVKKLAIKSVLTTKVNENDFIVLDNMNLDSFSTKAVAKMLDNLKVNSKTLIVLDSSQNKKSHKIK